MTDEPNCDENRIESDGIEYPVTTLEYGRARARLKWIKWLLIGSGLVTAGVLTYAISMFTSSRDESGYCRKCFRIESRRSWYFGRKRLWTYSIASRTNKHVQWNAQRDSMQKRPCSHKIKWGKYSVDGEARTAAQIHDQTVAALEKYKKRYPNLAEPAANAADEQETTESRNTQQGDRTRTNG
jgi:hypothetical protein